MQVPGQDPDNWELWQTNEAWRLVCAMSLDRRLWLGLGLEWSFTSFNDSYRDNPFEDIETIIVLVDCAHLDIDAANITRADNVGRTDCELLDHTAIRVLAAHSGPHHILWSLC